jgi:hypothetical protein
MFPFIRTVLDSRVDKTEVYEHPYGKHSLLSRFFGNVEGEYDLPGEVESERKEGHGVCAVADGLTCHQDIADGVGDTTNAQEYIVDFADRGVDMRR